jgi:hypothetical protein
MSDAPTSGLTNAPRRTKSVVLTSHPRNATGRTLKIAWGAADAKTRGPIIGTLQNPGERNAIGTHAGAYSPWRSRRASSIRSIART